MQSGYVDKCSSFLSKRICVMYAALHLRSDKHI